MKKLYKLLLICLLILSGGMALKAQNVDGTFSIESKEDLITFANSVKNNKSLNARLYADIDLEGGYWNTICETALYYNSYSNDYGYSGTFDGNGHVIKNFKVKSSTTADASAGLFGTVCGTIKNLGVENFTFEDGGKDIRAAAIVGQLITTGGKISNCYVKNATITPGEHVTGGIAGCVYDGTIENCYVVNSNINGSSGRYGYIVGDSRGDKSSTDRPGTVTNCYSDNTPLISDRKGNLSSVENKSAEQFASGEIAYLLQGNQQTDIWGQNIDNGETKETLPVLGGAKVYKIYNSGCTHYGEFIYSNDANAEFYHEHSFTEDSNGFCTLCNGYEAAELVDGVYHIGNLGQLMWFANNVNTTHKVLLTADITIDNSVVWKPIGLQDGASNSSIFNGDGHTITFDNTNEGSVFGLFGTYNYSIIENLYLAGSITCNTTDNVGALVNSAYRTTIRNVISYVEVTNIGSGRAGGLAGQFGGQHSGELYSLIENCAVYADVTGNVAGGIIGHGWSGNQYYDIKNVAYVGDVTGYERQAAVIAYHGNNSSTTKCKFENIYYCEKDALGFVGGGNTNYDLGTDVAAKTTEQFASGEVAYLLQGEQATQVWGQNIDNGETVQAYPVFGGAKIYKTSCGDNYYYSNANVEHSFNDNGFCNTCGNCEPAELVDNYYNISNAGNLVWFSKHVNDDNFSANAKLTNDIEMNAVQWTPIGTATAYNGTFDGNGYVINNLWHNTGVADGGREGLFTLIGSNGVVTNVTLNNATIWGSSPYGLNGTGGIAVRNEGCITNTMVTNSSIQQGAYEYLGGIAGWNKGSITNCAVINSTLTRRWGGANSGTMGGITQTNSGSVTNCYTYGCMFNNGNDLNSAIVAKGTAPVNSYYHTTDNVADAAETAKTKEQFASGEMAYLLQGEQTTQVWGQNIDNGEVVQQYPVFSDAKVYKYTFGDFVLYSNHKTYGKCGDNLYWYVDGNNTLTIYGTGAMYDYEYSSDKVPWRNLETPPTSLVLEEGITHIGNYAFCHCSGFTGDLTIPNSVTSIGNYAFYYCSGFTGDLTIPNSVTNIGDRTFYNCSGFTGSLTIPNSVTTIGDQVFRECYGFTGDLTIGNSVTNIGVQAFYKCYGFKGSLTIGNSVTTIGECAFENCSGFTGSLTIPNSVTTIGNYAFQNCSGFTGALTIPNSVTTIGNSAFYNCYGFTGDLTIPNSVTTIGNSAFENCYAFTGSLTIGNSVTTIGNDAFYYCSGFTGSLTIPNSVTTIGKHAFEFCYGFTGSLTIGNSVTTIGNFAFYYCYGFNGDLTIPNSVTTIGDCAFRQCNGFSDVYSFAVTAPTLLAGAFDKPNNATLYYPASSEQSYDDNGWFDYFSKRIGYDNNNKCGDNLYWIVNENTLTIFGTGAMYDYEYDGDNISPWRKLETAPTSLVLEEGITHIGNSAFDSCKGFTGDLTIPNSVTSIGNYAFYYCKGFTGSLTTPNSVTTIGNHAFYYCSGFTGDLTIGNSVTTIGESAFEGCSGLTGSLTIPNSVTNIGNYAFQKCSGFNGSLTIPNSVTTIGVFAFEYCSGLTGSLTIPNSVTSIGNSAFKNCFGFNGSLTIPNSVTSIGNSAFENCYGFTGSLTIPNSVTSIGEGAFYGCSSFTDVYSFAVTAPTLGTDAFDKPNNATLYYPASSEQSYNDNGWFEYFPQHIGFNGKCGDNLYWYVDDDNTLTIFGTGAMYDYNYYYGSNISPWKNLGTAPTSLMLEEGVTHIGNYAFYQCRGFKGSLTIPNSVTSIGNSAFDNCISFTGSLTIPNSITSIGNNAFRNCSGFKGSLTIGNSVTAIGNYAFYYCYGFTGSLTIPNSVTSIGESAFCSCSGFTEIFLYRDTNPTIGIFAFSGINANAEVCVPVIWESFDNIPEDKLVKMATFVGQQTTDNGQQSSSTGWVGLAEDQTWPDEDDHVAINASLVLGQQTTDNRLWVKSFGYCGDGTTVNGSITIEDGGQLYCEVARGEVTVKKEILGYQQSAVSGQQSGSESGSESESKSKWYTIASPLKDTIQITPNSTLLTPNSDYDLYRYDEPSHTWQNAKNSANNGFNTIEPSRGYLYANAKNTTLEFNGMINTDDVTYNLTAKSDVLNGFHLVGNPFTHNITFAHLNATEGASLVNGYYVLNGEGAWGATLGSNEDDVIKVGQGVLVKATAEGTLAIVKTQSRKDAESQSRGQQTTDNGQQSLCISVSNAKYSDRAFVVFDKGVGLDKMNHENENIPLLYIPMEDADYAIAMMDMNVNEIPVNFETNVMGEYTISLRQENCEFDELYLLDKETDEKVNILEQDYTFIATSSENPERFILMKNAQGSQLEAHSHFAYINNGDIVIYNIEGDADIKIFDALGRCVYHGESSDETTRIANGYSAGVYMIHKIDDNGVNVQKIIL